jgi:hypothetical protein
MTDTQKVNAFKKLILTPNFEKTDLFKQYVNNVDFWKSGRNMLEIYEDIEDKKTLKEAKYIFSILSHYNIYKPHPIRYEDNEYTLEYVKYTKGLYLTLETIKDGLFMYFGTNAHIMQIFIYGSLKNFSYDDIYATIKQSEIEEEWQFVILAYLFLFSNKQFDSFEERMYFLNDIITLNKKYQKEELDILNTWLFYKKYKCEDDDNSCLIFACQKRLYMLIMYIIKFTNTTEEITNIEKTWKEIRDGLSDTIVLYDITDIDREKILILALQSNDVDFLKKVSNINFNSFQIIYDNIVQAGFIDMTIPTFQFVVDNKMLIPTVEIVKMFYMCGNKELKSYLIKEYNLDSVPEFEIVKNNTLLNSRGFLDAQYNYIEKLSEPNQNLLIEYTTGELDTLNKMCFKIKNKILLSSAETFLYDISSMQKKFPQYDKDYIESNIETLLKESTSCDKINNILTIFEHAPQLEQDLIVYRGGNSLSNYNFPNRILISTTLSIDIANSFTQGSCCLYEIRILKGSKVLPLREISEHEDEQEILIHEYGTFTLDGEHNIKRRELQYPVMTYKDKEYTASYRKTRDDFMHVYRLTYQN